VRKTADGKEKERDNRWYESLNVEELKKLCKEREIEECRGAHLNKLILIE